MTYPSDVTQQDKIKELESLLKKRLITFGEAFKKFANESMPLICEAGGHPWLVIVPLFDLIGQFINLLHQSDLEIDANLMHEFIDKSCKQILNVATKE